MTGAIFYRWCRLLHGWLSAICFLILLFFAATGVLLNHPDWLRGRTPPLAERTIQLTPDETAAVARSADPARALVALARPRAELTGAFKDGDRSGDEVFVRLQGVRGSSDLRADLATGKVKVVVERTGAVGVLNDLHRGELAGGPWRLIVDVAGVLLIVMSLVGYAIFLSLRLRLRTAVILTFATLAGLIVVYALAVP